LTCLIVVADFQGKLITAFPATLIQAGLGWLPQDWCRKNALDEQ
jgi:hypothetical protein